MYKMITKQLAYVFLGLLIAFSLTGCEYDLNQLTKVTTTEEAAPPTVVSVLISGSQSSVVGVDINLTAQAVYDDGTTQDVTKTSTWTSSENNITVLEGNVSAISAGIADINASFAGELATHKVHFVNATFDHLEIQESYHAGGQGKIITNTTQTIELVDSVSYPTDTDGLSPNAYYPTVWAVYTDGSKVYVNTEAFWWADNQDDAYVNSIRGSWVFGKDINPSVKITATWSEESASFYVNVVAQSGKTLESIDIKNTWDEDAPNVTDVNVTVGDNTPLVAYGWFINTDGIRSYEYINANVKWSSSDPTIALIFDPISSNVNGIKEGDAVITAEWQGISADVNVKVLPNTSPTLDSIDFEVGCGSTETGEVINAANPLLLTVGQEQCINAWGRYSDGGTQRLTTTVFWTADNSAIASMDIFQRDSKVTGESLGSTFVSGSQDGVTGNAPVKVVEINSTFIAGADEIIVPATAQLNAWVVVDDGSGNAQGVIANDLVNWTSSDSSIATVDSTGLVSSIAEGDVNIIATAKADPSISATHHISVVEAELLSIQIEKGYNPTVPQPITELDVEITTEEYITTWALYSDGTRRYVNTDTVYWSSDQQIASINFLVSSNVYGRDLGTATIDAYYGGKKGSITVNVVNTGPQLLSIEIRDGWVDPNDVTGGQIDIEVGNNAPVVAYGHYDDNTTKDINAKVSWSSDDPSTAFIFDVVSSYVYGLKEGAALITAEWQGISAFVTANIVASTVPVLDHIEIQKGYAVSGNGEVLDDNNSLVMQDGDVQHVTAWAVYDNGDKIYINHESQWESEDNGIAHMDIAQRNSDVTAITEGNTHISVSYQGEIATASVEVRSLGEILKENIFGDQKDLTAISLDGKSASGFANSGAVSYYNEIGNDFEIGQKVEDTLFDFEATSAGTNNIFVNVYLKDEQGKNQRVDVGVTPYLTWDDVVVAHPSWTLRVFINTVHIGNFFLRIGDSSYTGSDAFTIDKFSVSKK